MTWNGRPILFLGYTVIIPEHFKVYWFVNVAFKRVGFHFYPNIKHYLIIIREPVISELTEQICEESFSCCPREKMRRTAGESSDPLCPVQRHHHKKGV